MPSSDAWSHFHFTILLTHCKLKNCPSRVCISWGAGNILCVCVTDRCLVHTICHLVANPQASYVENCSCSSILIMLAASPFAMSTAMVRTSDAPPRVASCRTTNQEYGELVVRHRRFCEAWGNEVELIRAAVSRKAVALRCYMREVYVCHGRDNLLNACSLQLGHALRCAHDVGCFDVFEDDSIELGNQVLEEMMLNFEAYRPYFGQFIPHGFAIRLQAIANVTSRPVVIFSRDCPYPLQIVPHDACTRGYDSLPGNVPFFLLCESASEVTGPFVALIDPGH